MRKLETVQTEEASALERAVFKDLSLAVVNTEFWYIQSDRALLRTIACTWMLQ